MTETVSVRAEGQVTIVLDQRVLEAVARLWAGAFCDEEVRVGEPIERRPEGGVVNSAHSAEQRIGEISPKTAPICATSRASPSLSSRAASDC